MPPDLTLSPPATSLPLSADSPQSPNHAAERERFLRTSSTVIFLIFFQTYMVAPLIPFLADALHTTRQQVGFLVPAYTIPYAFSGIACGALADRFGRRGLLYFSLIGFPIFSLAMAFAPGIDTLLAFRALSGICNAGIVVMALTLVGDLFPVAGRGRAIGWIFGAIAGGSAFGSTLAGILAPSLGWRGLFALTAAAALALLFPMLSLRRFLSVPRPAPSPLSNVLTGYVAILRNPRALRTYGFIFLNGVFHSGVFTWLGVHLHDRYGLGEMGIGLALLGYGVPGFLLGPAIGRIVDRHGRRRLIPAGFAIAAIAAFLFVPSLPLAVAVLAAPLLSLGFDMTHPLLAGIATTLDDRRRGQAMGLNTFAIFFGFGIGSLAFGALATSGTVHAFAIFAAAQLCFAAAAVWVFRSE